MGFFVFFSWLNCILVTLTLIAIFIKKRWWFFRPSLQIVLWFNLMVQWGGAFFSKYIYNFLPSPWHFFWVTWTIPFIIIIYNIAMGDLWVKSIWDKINQASLFHKEGLVRFFWVFIFFTFAINIYYFYKIPFKSTGLYNLFFNPLAANLAREESLKMISDSFIRYSYNIVTNAIAPILAVIIVILYLKKRKDISNASLYSFFFIIGLLYILFVASITGARGGSAGVILCILVAVYILKKMPIKPRYFLIGLFAVLFIPVIITLMREGKYITISAFIRYFSYLIKRICVSPMEACLWHMHYAQTNGIVGIEGVRPLAIIFGGEYINLPNIVGLAYEYNPLKTIHCDTGFFFDYYACFGIATIAISIFLTILLDFVLPLLRRCDILMIPLLSLMFFKSINFIESAYTVTFFTHGFILIPFLAFLSSISIKKISSISNKQKFIISIKG